MADDYASLPEVAPVPVIAVFPRRVDLGQIIRTREEGSRCGLVTVTNVGGKRAQVAAEVAAGNGTPAWLRCDPKSSFALEPQERREVFLYPGEVESANSGELSATVRFSCNNGSEYGLPVPEVAVAALVVEPARLEWVDGPAEGLDFGTPVQGKVCTATIMARRTPGNNLPTIISEYGVCDEDGNLHVPPPWVEISEPTPRRMDLLVKLTLHTANLPVGPIKEVIEFREDDPAVEPLKLLVSADVQSAPDIETTPESVKVQGSIGQTVPVIVKLWNTGVGSLPVKVTASVSWISIPDDCHDLQLGSKPTSVELLIAVPENGSPPRGVVMVTPVSQPRLLSLAIPVEAEALCPKLHIDKAAIQKGDGKSRQWEVPLENVGNADLTLEVRDCPPWLHVRPRGVLTVGPGDKELLVLSDRRRSKDAPTSCLLKLKTNQSGNETVSIPVSLPPVPERRPVNWRMPLLIVAGLMVAAFGFQYFRKGTIPAVTETKHDRTPEDGESSRQRETAEDTRAQDVDALLTQGLELKKKGSLNEAERKLRAVLQLDDKSVPAHYALAWTYVALKQKQMAIEHFRRVVELSPTPDETKAVEAKEALTRLGSL